MISLKAYTNDNLEFVALKAINLSTAGNKYKIKGYKRPNPKLQRESFIKADCVLTYTAQKQAIAYQQKANIMQVNMK